MSRGATQLGVEDLRKLKGATRLVIDDVGGVDATGAKLGTSHVHASRMQNVNDPTFMTIDRVAYLESLDGVDPHITRALADHSGHVLIALPKVPADGKWTGMLGEIAKDTGLAVGALAEALADDGAISGKEIVDLQLEQKIDEVIREAVRLKEALRAQRKADRGLAKGGR